MNISQTQSESVCQSVISGRLGVLQQKFGAAQETKSSLDSERVGKLDEMIAVGERSKPLYDSLPDTVARLESLQQLHLEAGEFSNNLLQMDSLQTQLSLQLANNLSLLQVISRIVKNYCKSFLFFISAYETEVREEQDKYQSEF